MDIVALTEACLDINILTFYFLHGMVKKQVGLHGFLNLSQRRSFLTGIDLLNIKPLF